MSELDGSDQYLLQWRPHMQQTEGSAGQTRDLHHRERSWPRPVDQGEGNILLNKSDIVRLNYYIPYASETLRAELNMLRH